MSHSNYIERPPRIQPEIPQETFEIPRPPSRDENALQGLIQMALPMLMIVGYILLAAFGQGRSLWMLIPMGLSIVASSGLAFYSYRNAQKLQRAKEEEYTRQLAEMRREMENYHAQQRKFYHYNYPMKRDTPAPPAASMRATKLGSAEKKGDSFIVTGILTTAVSSRSRAR